MLLVVVFTPLQMAWQPPQIGCQLRRLFPWLDLFPLWVMTARFICWVGQGVTCYSHFALRPTYVNLVNSLCLILSVIVITRRQRARSP